LYQQESPCDLFTHI